MIFFLSLMNCSCLWRKFVCFLLFFKVFFPFLSQQKMISSFISRNFVSARDGSFVPQDCFSILLSIFVDNSHSFVLYPYPLGFRILGDVARKLYITRVIGQMLEEILIQVQEIYSTTRGKFGLQSCFKILFVYFKREAFL